MLVIHLESIPFSIWKSLHASKFLPLFFSLLYRHLTVFLCRIFAAVATSVTALGVFVQPEAQAKRNKPVEEKKKEETEDKSLSAYDARLLANAKRKEAMKAKIDAAKAAANPIASAEK